MGNPLRNYVVAAGGNLADGVVLQKIAFWCSLNAKRGKKATTALSFPELAEQLGCTIHVIRYATERLLKAGVLSKEVRRFRGDRVSHWAVTEAGRKAISDCCKPQTGLVPTTDRSGPCNRPVGSLQQTLDSEQISEHHIEQPKPSDPADPAGGSGSGHVKVSGGVDPEEKEKAVAHKMHDVTPRPIDKSKNGLTPASAEAFWRDAWKEHKGTYCLQLVTKDRKALVVLAEACKDVGMKFDVFLGRLFTEWPAICAHAKATASAYSIPTEPGIHWVLQWRQAVMTYLLEPKAVATGWEPGVPKSLVQPFPVQSTASSEPPEDKPITLAEIQQLMEEDD